MAGTARIDQQAAEWIVQLTADTEAERAEARAGFDAWKRADTRHAAAAARLEAFLGDVKQAGRPGSRPARAALDAAPRRRRGPGAGAALVLAAALALPVGFGLVTHPPAYLAADLRSGTGQWTTHTLSDGSRVTLDSGSAVDLHFDGERRSIDLVRGRVLVDVAPDAARPFVVRTPQGTLTALGTRFTVARTDGVTTLTMLESHVRARTGGDHPEERVVSAGERVRLEAGGLSPTEAVDTASVADAWAHHQLVVGGRPLPEVLDELDRHRPGLIRYDRRRIEHLRVSAVLPLDDPDRALALLSASFPQLRLRTLTPYLLWVDAPAAP